MGASVFALSACLFARPVAPLDLAPSIQLENPSGTTVGTMSRTDGTFPFRSLAAGDRVDCLRDRRHATIGELKGVLRLSRRDRDGAYLATVRLTAKCLATRGWTIAFCGGGGEPDCPEAPPPYEPPDEEH